MKFIAHYSGSGGNLYELQYGTAGHRILIECGVTIHRLLKAVGDLATVDACLVSHEHLDHARCMDDLRQLGATVEWSQYISQPPRRAIDSFWGVRDGDSWGATPFPVRHDAECRGWYIEIPGQGALAYVTDAMYCPVKFPKVTHFALEANYDPQILDREWKGGRLDNEQRNRIVQSHMSIETTLGILKANDLSRLKEVHLLHLSNRHSNAEDFKRRVQAITGVPVFIAQERPREVA